MHTVAQAVGRAKLKEKGGVARNAAALDNEFNVEEEMKQVRLSVLDILCLSSDLHFLSSSLSLDFLLVGPL